MKLRQLDFTLLSDLSLRRFSLSLRDSVSFRPANGLYHIVGYGKPLSVATKVPEGSAASFSR
jgi:hypothetical protein